MANMPIRLTPFKVGLSNISPACQYVGRRGDNNATIVTFELVPELISTAFWYRFEFVSAQGAFDTTPPVQLASDQTMLSVKIVNGWTQTAGRHVLRLVITDSEGAVAYTGDCLIRIDERDTGTTNTPDVIETRLTALILDTEAARDAAQAVADNVQRKLDNGDFIGAQGPQGIQGAQGIQGIQGIQGEKGYKGDTGDPGIDGNALVASYTRTGNIEIVPTSVDIGTGTFTAAGHGMANGIYIFPTGNLMLDNLFPLASYPGGLTPSLYYVVGATADTFQISLTAGGVAVTFTSIGDFSKWHFEKGGMPSITIAGLPASKKYRVIAKFKTSHTSSTYLIPHSTADTWVTNKFVPAKSTLPGYPIMCDRDGLYSSTSSIFGYVDAIFTNTPVAIMTYKGFCLGIKTATTVEKTTIDFSAVRIKTDYPDIVAIQLNSTGAFLANGSTLEVYTA